MKIAYVRPYEGEIDIVSESMPEIEFVAVQDVTELDESTRIEIEVLSVFVDYQVTAQILDLLPNLKMITTRSAGYDHIDTAATKDRNITVCRVPHYGTRTVAEYAIALMFALSRNAFRSYTDMQRDVGITNFEAYEGFDLYGKTLGIVGTGAIGRSVCTIARGIGMNVVAYDVSPDESFATENDVIYATLDEVLAQADIVSLHVPSIPTTQHLINEEKLRIMKPGSYLINTARGEVVDTKALVQCLNDGHLAGAGLDVLEGEHALREEAELLTKGTVDTKLWETLVADHALIDMPNVIVTPHIAFNTVEAKREITDITLTNIESFIAGESQNIVLQHEPNN
jgi:D-lactate dehydrogenase